MVDTEATTFGARLRAIRGWRDITQQELGERVGVPASVISRIESEIVLPVPSLEKKIKQALGWAEALTEIQVTPG